MKKPNILLITTDQERFDHLGVKGLTAIGTPNLDRLATEGVHFDRAYSCMPTCTPARVSLLTGQYPSSHGAYSIGVTMDPFPRPTLADLLSGAGYATALFGKTHFVAREDESRHVSGLEDRFSDEYRGFDGPYLGFKKIQTSTGHTINQKPDMHYRIFLEDSGADYKPWFPLFHPEYDHHRCGAWEIPVEYTDTAWVGGLTEGWIRDHADGQPWFCWASFQDPHEPFVCPEPWFSRVDRSKLTALEGPREGEFADKPVFYGKAVEGDWREFDDGNMVPSSFATPTRDARALDALQATLGMVGFIDDRVGAMLRALEETGQLDNTIVVFTTDHGEMHGHHGFWGKGLTAYDDCQRIPFLVWGPGYIRPRGTVDALASLVDIPRTVLAFAGVDVPLGMQGVSLQPVLQGESDRVRESVLIECQATQRVYQQTMVTDRHKLVIYRDSDEGELYDIKEDPNKYENLWGKPECQGLKTDLLLEVGATPNERGGESREAEGLCLTDARQAEYSTIRLTSGIREGVGVRGRVFCLLARWMVNTGPLYSHQGSERYASYPSAVLETRRLKPMKTDSLSPGFLKKFLKK